MHISPYFKRTKYLGKWKNNVYYSWCANHRTLPAYRQITSGRRVARSTHLTRLMKKHCRRFFWRIFRNRHSGVVGVNKRAALTKALKCSSIFKKRAKLKLKQSPDFVQVKKSKSCQFFKQLKDRRCKVLRRLVATHQQSSAELQASEDKLVKILNQLTAYTVGQDAREYGIIFDKFLELELGSSFAVEDSFFSDISWGEIVGFDELKLTVSFQEGDESYYAPIEPDEWEAVMNGEDDEEEDDDSDELGTDEDSSSIDSDSTDAPPQSDTTNKYAVPMWDILVGEVKRDWEKEQEEDDEETDEYISDYTSIDPTFAALSLRFKSVPNEVENLVDKESILFFLWLDKLYPHYTYEDIDLGPHPDWLDTQNEELPPHSCGLYLFDEDLDFDIFTNLNVLQPFLHVFTILKSLSSFCSPPVFLLKKRLTSHQFLMQPVSLAGILDASERLAYLEVYTEKLNSQQQTKLRVDGWSPARRAAHNRKKMLQLQETKLESEENYIVEEQFSSDNMTQDHKNMPENSEKSTSDENNLVDNQPKKRTWSPARRAAHERKKIAKQNNDKK